MLDQSAKLEAALREQGMVFDDPELAAYLAGHIATLAAPAAPGDPSYRVAVLRDPMINAFALPNGSVYLNAGALAHVEDEAQLVLLLAHEMNHISRAHSERGLADFKRKTITAKIATTVFSPVAAALGGGLGLSGFELFNTLGYAAAVTGYSRELEEEADTGGLELVARAGYQTQAAPRLFSVLNEVDDPSALAVYWSDHPANAERERDCTELVTSGAVAANPDGRNDVEALTVAMRRVSLENLRLRIVGRHYDFALTETERAMTRYGETADLRYYEGEARRRMADDPEAVARERAWRARDDFDPDDVKDLKRSSDATLDRAEQSFKRALELDPAHGPSRRALGQVFLRRGNAAAAAAELNAYLDANPGAPDARMVERLLERIRKSAAAAPETKEKP